MSLSTEYTVQWSVCPLQALGVQSALLTVRQLNKRFPWLDTSGIEGAVLGLEAEGWMDNWNLLRGLKLRNIHQGVDYIRGEVTADTRGLGVTDDGRIVTEYCKL